jgi:methionine aminotransferase
MMKQNGPPSVPGKLDHLGTTIFSTMSALAQAHQAINLAQGFPNFDCDPRLTQLASEAMQAGHNQYAPMPGLPRLRQEVASLVHAIYGASVDPDTEITITVGATEGLFGVISTFVHPGDEVIVFEPAYDAYLPAIQANGGIPVPIPLTLPGYHIDWERVEAAITSRSKALLLNFPHNPTGSLLRPADIEALHRLVARHDLMLISDDVYEHIVFDDQAHLSLSRYPDLASRAVVISSFGKTLHTTGWKVGYVLAPAPWTAAFRKIHQFMTFSVSTPFQHAIAQYLHEARSQVLGLKQVYQQKRDTFLALMQESRFEALPCPGTYFQLMRYGAISDQSEAAFARWLTTEVGVAAIPVSAFYQDGSDHRVIRFCFAKDDQTLQAAAERLCAL